MSFLIAPTAVTAPSAPTAIPTTSIATARIVRFLSREGPFSPIIRAHGTRPARSVRRHRAPVRARQRGAPGTGARVRGGRGWRGFVGGGGAGAHRGGAHHD